MTILFGMLGFLVFVFSCFTVGFNAAFKRWLGFVAVGITIDILFLVALFFGNDYIILYR